MATNKNQHFVPRCYLKQFANDSTERAINLYNIDKDRYIQGAPIKNQCSRDYFYGRNDRLEEAIQGIERMYGEIISKALSPGYKLTDEHRFGLRIFWLFQYLRTEAASRRAVDMNRSFTEVAGIPAATYRMQIKDAVEAAMQAFSESMHIISDIKVCIVRNRSPIPFVTSDDPAILSNRWHLHNNKRLGRSFGLHSAGDIIMLPISPKILLLGYDGDVHSVPHSDGWVNVASEEDIDAFNQHQYLNACANVFVQNPSHFAGIQKSFKNICSRRLLVRHRINYAIFDKENGNYTRYVVADPDNAPAHERALIHLESLHSTPLRWPKVLQWRSNAHAYSNGTGLGLVRRAVIMKDAGKNNTFRKVPLRPV